MSNDIHQLPQCTCSALFLSSDALNVHLQEYQARESYLSAQQEICRSHSKANDDDDDLDRDDDDDPDVYEDGDSPAIRHDNGDKTHNCPLRECDRNIPFKTRQRLRRHFEQHVKCEEVCVYCHQVSRRVSDYIRHAKRHRDVGKTKATYINQMCDELRNRAANELGLAESELSRVERRSKKRARDEGYIDSRTSGAQNAELHTLDMTIMNEFDFQPANDTQAVLPSMQSATILMPLSNVAEPVATGGFPNMSREAFYPEPIEGPTAAPDDINFDAPINGIINFPEWIGWMQVENRTGN